MYWTSALAEGRGIFIDRCDPIENGSQIHHEYFTSLPISEMCPRRVEMKYKEGCVRYDEQTRDVLTRFLETGKVIGKFVHMLPQ